MLRTAFGSCKKRQPAHKLTHVDSSHLIFDLRRPLNQNSNEMTAKQKSPLLFRHHALALPVTRTARLADV